ncbi:MAG: alpha/beta hydrolase-fold protein, partial [Pseudomonas sp.]
MSLENISCQKSFGGWHKRYRHRSDVLGCDMVFAVYLPPQAEQGGKLPVLYWLSGLT